jgi:hypothetical protein
MNTITTAAMSPRKLALYTTANNEWSDAPESAYLEIDAEQARAMIDLLVMTTRFRDEADRAGLLSPFYSVTAGTGERIPNFRLLPIPFLDDAPLDAERPVVRLPNDFCADAVPPDHECRVECHRIEIAHGHVRFTALAKHGDHRFTTADLELRLLQAIADGRADELARPALKPADANG